MIRKIAAITAKKAMKKEISAIKNQRETAIKNLQKLAKSY